MAEFWTNIGQPVLFILAQIMAIIVPLLITVAYYTYAERKILALAQRRKGPNLVGPFGLLQPFADGLKLVGKETILPSGADQVVFLLAPILTFMLSLVAWAVVPVDMGWVLADINVGILYLFAISSLGIYGVVMAGWASNSRYAFLGGLRSAAQMVSYELVLALIVAIVIMTAGSFNLTEIVMADRPWWLTLLMVPLLVLFFIGSLAETNRSPFDLPEGESELAGGYNVEYSSMAFALFFLGEYANMILMSAMITILFLGGWRVPFDLDIALLSAVPGVVWFVFKTAAVMFCFVWVRATMPRYRYDQLMRLCWKVFLPFLFFWFVVIAMILFYTGNPTMMMEAM